MTFLTYLINLVRSWFTRDVDTYDPSDDEDTPADIDDIDDTEPVALELGRAGEEVPVPADWDDEPETVDIDGRLTGVDLTPDPEDGRTEYAG